MKTCATIGILLFAIAAVPPAHGNEPKMEAFDAFARAAAEIDGTPLDARYREMMSSMEIAYDRYL